MGAYKVLWMCFKCKEVLHLHPQLQPHPRSRALQQRERERGRVSPPKPQRSSTRRSPPRERASSSPSSRCAQPYRSRWVQALVVRALPQVQVQWRLSLERPRDPRRHLQTWTSRPSSTICSGSFAAPTRSCSTAARRSSSRRRSTDSGTCTSRSTRSDSTILRLTIRPFDHSTSSYSFYYSIAGSFWFESSNAASFRCFL